MPYKFVDDGYPEADDYASNYVWVEEAEAQKQEQKPASARLATAEVDKTRAMLKKRLRIALQGGLVSAGA